MTRPRSVTHSVSRAWLGEDVTRHGLPTDSEIALRVQHAGITHGRFVMIASTRIARPSISQRRVAVTLADQVGAAIGPHHNLT